jgi:hypothetical protein
MGFSPSGFVQKRNMVVLIGGEERLGEALRHPIYISVLEIQGERVGASVGDSDGERESSDDERCTRAHAGRTTRIHGPPSVTIFASRILPESYSPLRD